MSLSLKYNGRYTCVDIEDFHHLIQLDASGDVEVKFKKINKEFKNAIRHDLKALNLKFSDENVTLNSNSGYIHPKTLERIKLNNLSVKISKNALVGDIAIGNNVVIEASVISDNVTLGDNVTIGNDCFVSEYCNLGDGVDIAHSVIMDEQNMMLKGGVKIGTGCFIGKKNVFLF